MEGEGRVEKRRERGRWKEEGGGQGKWEVEGGWREKEQRTLSNYKRCSKWSGLVFIREQAPCQ